jgi:hypothetical protein
VSDQLSSPVIVVGVDGSEASRAALRWATHQAELTAARMRPVQAWRLPALHGMPVDFSNVDFEKHARENLRATVEETLRSIREYLSAPQVVEAIRRPC